MSVVGRVLGLLGPRAGAPLVLIVLMSAGGAALEGLGLGLILPFISLVSDPSTAGRWPALTTLAGRVGLTTPGQLFAAGAALLGLVYVLKNGYLAAMYWIEYRWLYARETLLVERLWRAYLHASYSLHCHRNPADALKRLGTDVSLIVNQVIVPALTLLVEVLILMVVGAILFVAEPVAMATATTMIGAFTVTFHRGVRRRIAELGRRADAARARMYRMISAGAGGIKEVKVLDREASFVGAVVGLAKQYAGAASAFQAIGQLPRLFIESFAVLGVLLVVMVTAAHDRALGALLPVLALFAAAGFRIIPALSRIVNAVSTIRYYWPAVDLVGEELRLLEAQRDRKWTSPAAGAAPPPRHTAIELRGVWYRHPGADRPTVRGVSALIPCGTSVALVGPSGAGKTTLVDIIVGLLPPERGDVLVDGRSIHEDLPAWQRRVGYVPQAIYLADDSIRRNVAFGLRDAEIDDTRVWRALTIARLREFVESLPGGLEAPVGERGVRISGGQRQRLGIARALYHDPEVLVMDEATTGLDSETEAEVAAAIERFNGEKTLFVVAHGTTIEKCQMRITCAAGDGVWLTTA